MNIQRIKGIVWLGSVAVGGVLAFRVYDFLKNQGELAKAIPPQELAAVLDSVKEPGEQKTDLVEYESIKKIFHDYDWTGKPPEVVKVVTPGEKPPETKVAVSSLLKVLAIKVDTSKPENSRAYVKFVDAKLQVHTDKDDSILQPDERLFTPYQDVRVEAITGEGVVFAFDDAAREKETVRPPPYTSTQRGDLGIVQVGPEGAIKPELQTLIGVTTDFKPYRPDQMQQIRKNEFQVGTQTVVDLERDYSRILSRDLSYSTYKNPRTGANEGIKINHVEPGSIPAQAGLGEGEVLKSINGHKVTSVNDAVAFVKANVNTTDTWVAVFEKQGREFTRTYHSPEQ